MNNPYFRTASPHERRMMRILDEGLSEFRGRSAEGGFEGAQPAPKPLSRSHYALCDFSKLMGGADEREYHFGVRLCAIRLRNIAPGCRSFALTRMARLLYDGVSPPRSVRESEVAEFGRFVSVIIKSLPKLVLSWVEDMHTGLPGYGLDAQPTAVIRGILFSPLMDQKRACRFWALAAGSERFPCRIFSDPCEPDEGAILSPHHIRAFGLFFSIASEAAIERFARHLRDHADRKSVRNWEAIGSGGRWVLAVVPASEAERRRILEGIAGYVDDRERKDKLTALFQAEA